MLTRALSLALALSWTGAAAAQVPISPPPGYVGTWHGVRPTDAVRTFSGRCGQHAYFIAIAPASAGGRGLEEVRVDGIRVPDSRLQAVRKSIPDAATVMDSSINDCLTNGAARLRLFAVNWHVHPVDERFIDFTVDGRGVVHDLNPND